MNIFGVSKAGAGYTRSSRRRRGHIVRSDV